MNIHVFMHHVAIMKKSWDLTHKILSGEKRIESRWYKTKCTPWDTVQPGDMVYFKDSGEPITIKAEVHSVLQYSDLTPRVVNTILNKYGKDIGIHKSERSNYFDIFKHKKYCILIFLNKPKIISPFNINKKGFGAMCAWITVEDITSLISSS